MSTDKSAAPAAQTKPEEKPRPKRTVVRLLRPVKGIVNNPGEICGFSPEVAAKLLDKNRQGGALAELYEPPKK
jgi:hypothetical protein